MKVKRRQSGLTLMEQTVIVAAIALLVVLGVPAVRAFIKSLESRGGARAMISASLSTARAIAAKEQRYAGVRFQTAYHPEGLLKAPQYIIFIVQDPEILAYGFRAVEGLQPIKLPDSVGVMDLRYRTKLDPEDSGDAPIDEDNDIDDPNELRDTTTFSIIFSPSGKLVIHDVRVRNRDGETGETNKDSKDDIFNTKVNIEDEKIAMFYQDDYTALGLGQEASRNSFIIYDKDIFEKVDKDRRYNDYLKDLEVIYINPYTGTIINK